MVVQFDATLDDFVDVTMRGLARSSSARSMKLRGFSTNALVGWFALFAIVQGSLAYRFAAGLIAALVATGISLATYKSSLEKRIRRICLEQNGTDEPVRIDVELTDAGISVSQLKTRCIYDWSTILEIEEGDDAIFFFRPRGSLFAVRNRAFESPQSRSEFIREARQFMNAAKRSAPVT